MQTELMDAESAASHKPTAWLLYLSSQDDRSAEYDIPPGQTFKVCEVREFSEGVPLAQVELSGATTASAWMHFDATQDQLQLGVAL